MNDPKEFPDIIDYSKKLDHPSLEELLRNAIEQERERCAKIAENAIASDSPLIAWDEFPNERKGNVWNTALLIAAAIRCDCQTLNQFHTVDCASNKDEK